MTERNPTSLQDARLLVCAFPGDSPTYPTANSCNHPPPTRPLAPSKHPTHHPTVTHMAGPGKTWSDQGREGLTGTLQPSRPRRLAPFPRGRKVPACLLEASRTGVRLHQFAGGR